MPTTNELTVRRFYEEMCNGRHNEIAADLFSETHRLHDPQVQATAGPEGMREVVRPYQEGVDGHWVIDAMYSMGDTVVVRWHGNGKHVGDINGIPPTGSEVHDINAITIHQLRDGKIAESWEVWDTLGFLQQLGAVPQP